MLPSSARVFVAGATGTGKSHFLRNVLLPKQPRAIVLDYTADFYAHRRELGANVVVAESLQDVRAHVRKLAGASSWRVLAMLDAAESAQLGRLLLPERLHSGASLSRALGGVALVCDELNQFAPHNAPADILNLWRRGRHVGLTILGATQAPADVAPVVRGMSRYLVLFQTHEPNALAYFARVMPPAALEALQRCEKFGCICYDAERRVTVVLDSRARVRDTLTH